MATIVNTTQGIGAFAMPKTALTGTDTLVFVPTVDQALILYNTTVSPIVVTIDGSTGTTVVIPGTAGATASIASGTTVTVPANNFQVVRLNSIPAYLQGTVAVTGGTGLDAAILQ